MNEGSLQQRLAAYLALERLTLSELSREAGYQIDWAAYRDGLRESIDSGIVVDRWQGDIVIALATMKALSETHWFLTMLALHPQHRGPKKLGSFLQDIARQLVDQGAQKLSSHVLKNNSASVALHRRLGFQVVKENDRGYAFECDLTNTDADNRPRIFAQF